MAPGREQSRIGGGGGGDGDGDGDGAAHINVSSGSANDVPVDERSGPVPAPLKLPDLKVAAERAGCELRLGLPDEGHSHLPPSASTPAYETKPPTSGSHVESPYQQADGAYSKMPKEIDFVHSLEHGRMALQYSPSLPEEDELALRGLYDTLYAGTLFFPNGDMPYQVAAATWTNLIGCKTYRGSITDDAIRDFGKATWGRFGGEGAGGIAAGGDLKAIEIVGEGADDVQAGAVGADREVVRPTRRERRAGERRQRAVGGDVEPGELVAAEVRDVDVAVGMRLRREDQRKARLANNRRGTGARRRLERLEAPPQPRIIIAATIRCS